VLEHRWMVRAAIKNLKRVQQPTLIMHSREDDYADLNNATYLQGALGGTVDTVVLEDSYHMVTLDKQRQVVVDYTRAFVDRIVKEACTAAANVAPANLVRLTGAGSLAAA
jgi:carboxylesterase